MTSSVQDPYNVAMPTTARRPAPKLAASHVVSVAEEAVKVARELLEVAETHLEWAKTAEEVAAEAERVAREGKEPTIVYDQATITRLLGVARQTVQKQYASGKYPPENLRTPDQIEDDGSVTAGRPLWFPEALQHAGVVPSEREAGVLAQVTEQDRKSPQD